MRGRTRTHERGGRRVSGERSELRVKAEEIQSSTGIPYNLALHVARGERTLSSVLERLVAEEKDRPARSEHDIPKSLAAQVALGQADLEAVLLKRELDAHIHENKEKSVLVDRASTGSRSASRYTASGLPSASCAAWTCTSSSSSRGQGTEKIHKLQAKYAWNPDEYKLVKKGSTARRRGARTPSPSGSRRIAIPSATSASSR
jgi:hypothetical protein